MAAVAIGSLLASLSAGCAPSVSVPIRRHPAFYDPDLKQLAVLPLASEALDPRAGRYVTDRLIRELRENETYEVSALPVSAGDGDANSSGLTYHAALAQLQPQGGVDLLLAGSVLTFDASQTVGYHEYPDTFYGGIGYPYSYFGYRRVIVARPYEVGLAVVELRIRLLRVNDGSTLYLSDPPIRVRLRDASHPVKVQEELLREATSRAIGEVLGAVSVVEMEIEINPDKALTIERVRDGRRRAVDDFRDGDHLAVIVDLPREADRNRFQLEIRPETGGEAVETRSFVWNSQRSPREMLFDPAGWIEPGEEAEFDLVLLRGKTVVASEDVEVQRHPKPSDR
jgi:hypothetical protein